MSSDHFDVLIVGAGLSGIGAGYHLQKECPDKTYAILEGRTAMGGTWDLFRYPGIRSDSDMFTLGFAFRPWKGKKSIADGDSIASYIRDTATENGVDKHIRFRHRVVSAAWSSPEARWTVEALVGDELRPVTYTCNFLYFCSGYYNYENGFTPEFAGRDEFGGQIIHPQHWPEDLDYRGKRIVVIGSGATAVTLIPSLAFDAKHVTMLQRSPSYIASLPAADPIANLIRKILPEKLAYAIVRWKNVLLSMYFYQYCRRRPERAKALLRKLAMSSLPSGYDVDTHFKPKYNPWDQRLCLVPDSDLFKAIGAGRASIVTDQVDRFTKTGILLKSGRELPADIIITATGLQLLMLGGVKVTVDGNELQTGQSYAYKGVMLSDVPNCALAIGYTNASWTLRAELATKYITRLLNYMSSNGYTTCVAPHDPSAATDQGMLNLTSGYVQRGISFMPKQGARSPWRVHQNYILDLAQMGYGKVTDQALVFSRNGATAPKAREEALVSA
jgi:monooxygenase